MPSAWDQDARRIELERCAMAEWQALRGLRRGMVW